MQVSVVNYKDLNFEFRIDAEYYRTEVLNKVKLLDKTKNDILKNLASFVMGPFGSTVTVDKYVEKSDYRYVRNKDISDFLIGTNEPAYIPEEVFSSLPQFHIHKEDLLITVVGTLGKVAITRENDTNAIFSCKSTVIRARRIDPYYLLTYLNTNTGQVFAVRGVRGAIQQGLNLSDLQYIKIFIPSDLFQHRIREVVSSSFEMNDKAAILYASAEKILLSELGMSDWNPKYHLSFIRNYSDSKSVDRIDAEYFQPVYDEIIKAIKSAKSYARLGDLVSMKKCVEPGSEAYQDSGIPFVRVSNLSKFGINDDNQQFISESLYESLKMHQPLKGEILLSKDATPGIAYYLSDVPGKMIPSSGILRLTVKDAGKIIPEYLTLVLNSVVVQKQIERDVGGSVINHWLVDQVKNTIIPVLDYSVQKEISAKIAESFLKRKQSKSLLEIAKSGVEMAIEKSAEEALNWINQEVDKK